MNWCFRGPRPLLNNNNYFANSFHIGCFLASNTNAIYSGIYSRKSSYPSESYAFNKYFVGANARGIDYDCFSFQQWTYLQALFILLFKSTNSQAAHSSGFTGGESVQNNAGLSTTTYGMAGKVRGATTRMAFFWIHDLWGNLYQYIGGLWSRANDSTDTYYWLPRASNSRAWDNGSWNSTSSSNRAKQTNLGDSTGGGMPYTQNWIKEVTGTNKAGFLFKTGEASATTFWCDYGGVYYYSSRAYFPYVGGYFGEVTNAGLFYCLVYFGSTSSGIYYGSRLSYRGGH